MRRKQLRSDHGFAMIEAVIAMGLVGLASLGLLTVTFAMSSQARLSKDAINARLAAEQISESATVHGCGLQTGGEVSSVIVAAKTRCNTALGLDSGNVILGDVSTSVTRKTVVYSATIRNSWLPGPGADGLSAVTCANLQTPTSPATFATMTPNATKRVTTVTWKFGSADSSSADKSYTLTKFESVPPDAAAVDVHRVVPVVVELAPGGVARALETERGGREEGREGGRGRVRERASPAHSFPVVEKGTARGGNSTRERRAGARARATSSPTHACIRR